MERGKERLQPKKHKPTKLKKIIAAELTGRAATAVASPGVVNGASAETVEGETTAASVDGAPPSSESPTDAAPPKLLVERPFAVLDINHRSPTELEMNRKIVHMLSELRRFQARAFAKNPDKAKKRVISGLREVERAARRNKLKGVLMAPNGKTSIL